LPTSPLDEGGNTPRLQPLLSRQISDIPTPLVGKKTFSDAGSVSASSQSGGQSVSSVKGSRRLEPVNRAYSVHGSISIRATTVDGDSSDPSPGLPVVPFQQVIGLPFFATVCKSLFTAAPIDPVSNLVTGAQLSSGQLTIDFGSEPVVGGEYHRDILLVNRSEIELVWTTAVVNSRFKDDVWFALRDLDSENVFGVDRSAQPMPLPALSSRHLRLELRVKAAVVDFEFDFVIANSNQTGNVVTCKAIGSGQASGTDASLKITSGTSIDFGQICDGVWARKTITCKNSGDQPLDVQFTATPGYEVAFKLAGVAGEDMEEELLEKKTVDKKLELSRTNTREARGREREVERSPKGSVKSLGPAGAQSMAQQSRNEDGQESLASSDRLSSDDRDPSRPPSRALSRVTSRASSYRIHTTAAESEDEDEPFFNGGETANSSSVRQPESGLTIVDSMIEKEITNQIEDLRLRPGAEYRISVLYRPARDLVNPPEVAGALRQSAFKLFLDSALVSQRADSRSRRTLNCIAESCTSIIEISSGNKIDFGEVTVGASKTANLSIANRSALSARVEIAAISKVLRTNRSIIIIPPFETVDERLEFFPRRINDEYEKQVFVRNLLNRMNGMLAARV
jgi:hypothetical protein